MKNLTRKHKNANIYLVLVKHGFFEVLDMATIFVFVMISVILFGHLAYTHDGKMRVRPYKNGAEILGRAVQVVFVATVFGGFLGVLVGSIIGGMNEELYEEEMIGVGAGSIIEKVFVVEGNVDAPQLRVYGKRLEGWSRYWGIVGGQKYELVLTKKKK